MMRIWSPVGQTRPEKPIRFGNRWQREEQVKAALEKALAEHGLPAGQGFEVLGMPMQQPDGQQAYEILIMASPQSMEALQRVLSQLCQPLPGGQSNEYRFQGVKTGLWSGGRIEPFGPLQ